MSTKINEGFEYKVKHLSYTRVRKVLRLLGAKRQDMEKINNILNTPWACLECTLPYGRVFISNGKFEVNHVLYDFSGPDEAWFKIQDLL